MLQHTYHLLYFNTNLFQKLKHMQEKKYQQPNDDVQKAFLVGKDAQRV